MIRLLDHLMFTLHGPFASWGDVAPGNHRPTLDRPTKSAVMGLVAAALGIPYDDDEPHRRLDGDLGFAVRTDSAGRLMRDYHTVQTIPTPRKLRHASRRHEVMDDPQNLETILTSRDYRTDGWWTVALWSRGPDPRLALETLREALLRPRFMLYLGRKSCPPGLPLHPEIVTTGTLRDAFASYRPPHLDLLGRPAQLIPWLKPARLSWEPDHPAPGWSAPSRTRDVRDALDSRVRRTFRARTEHIIEVDVPTLEEVTVST